MILAASGFFQTVSSKYAVIFIGSVITNLLLGFYNIFCYKLPYYIFDMKNYGKLMAVSGFCYSGISVGFTALVTFLTKKFNYLSVTVAAFWISALFFVISAVLTFSYKLKEIENEGKKQTENENQSAPAPVGNTIYKQALFYKTLPAHLLRGIGTGIFLLMSVIGIYGGILNTQTAVALTFIYAASSATGNLLYSVGLKWINDRKILTLSGLFFLFAVPVCGISTNLILFYVFYFIANALNITLGIGVPAVVVQTVDYAYIGTYTSWRMLIFTLGIALPGFFLEPMMKATGIFIPLLISGVCICVSCFMYGLYLKETR